MMGSARTLNEDGFTMIELLLAVLIFSMVMGGLAVIHSAAFKQGGRMVYETRLKHMALISQRALQKELTAATRLEVPVPGASGRHLRGLKNVATDGFEPMNGNNGDTGWFHFCVSANSVAPCGQPSHPASCLWYYSGSGSTPPVIGDGNCGNSVGGATPQVLASHIQNTALVGGLSYFTRLPAHEVEEDNQIRANFRMMQGANQNIGMPIRLSMDASFNMNFSGT